MWMHQVVLVFPSWSNLPRFL
uniref:Uncharacterized protein n=1 Tax=Anguilla anguilla TaxID=7936 RepID=A0A0E9RBH8_ANGAN